MSTEGIGYTFQVPKPSCMLLVKDSVADKKFVICLRVYVVMWFIVSDKRIVS